MDELEPFINFPKNCNIGGWTRYKQATLGQHIEYCEAHIKKCEDLVKRMQDQLQQQNAIESLRALSNFNVAEEFNEISSSLKSEPPSKPSRVDGKDDSALLTTDASTLYHEKMMLQINQTDFKRQKVINYLLEDQDK